jgi:hypothetical protein
MRVYVFIFLLFVFGCKTQPTDSNKSSTTEFVKYFPVSSKETILDCGIFSIKVPDSWIKPNDDTLELNNCTCGVSVGRIQIGSNEFINYTYGYGVQSIFDTAYSYQRPKSFVFPKLKNYQIWEDVKDNYKIQYFKTNNIDTGYTGLFIDSIGKTKDVSFVMTGENLDSVTKANVLKAINSIRLKFKDEW